MRTADLNRLAGTFSPTSKMPVLFLGHGSPMNAIEENEFVQGFRRVSSEIASPKAILCISAHWETTGTKVSAMESPPTIHDFNGFPRALFEVQYPAPGSPALAAETRALVTSSSVEADHSWGLDHGAWSVIRHMYPEAKVPVIQLSLDRRQDARFHYSLARELSMFRERGVLIVGSGNMVHNLGQVDWRRLNDRFGHDWALEADSKMQEWIMDDNHQALIEYGRQGSAFRMAIPTPEHYLPLLYVLALKGKKEPVSIFNNQPVAGSITMTSAKIGV